MNKGGELGVIIVAAGSSRRMGGICKNFAHLGGKPLLAWSVDTCQKCSLVQQIVIVLSETDMDEGKRLREERDWSKVTLCLGGARRQDSVKEGLHELGDCAWVMIHDGARPFLTEDLIEDGLKAVEKTGTAAAAVPVKDTIKLADDKRLVEETLQRDRLWATQTPQIFMVDIITQAYKELTSEVTDDAAAVEHMGHKVELYMGAHDNIKVTTPEDLALARIIAGYPLSLRGAERRSNLLRIGIGYDSHPLVLGRRLILGGVNIPHDKGLSGWSDADVAVHAMIDALCGAANLGDIGTLFPSGETEYKDISSLVLLRRTNEQVIAKGFKVVNIDVTIIAQSPELSSFIPEMRVCISHALGVESTQVTIKATTSNGLGFIGRAEGIAAQAVALIQG